MTLIVVSGYKIINFVTSMLKLRFLLIVILFANSCKQKEVIDIDNLKIELDSIMVLDQKYRSQLNAVFNQFGKDSKEFKDLVEKQNDIDSLNLIYVENLIQKHGGYPGNSLVGHSRGDVVFFVLQHSSSKVQDKYLQLIIDAAKNDELKGGLAAMYHDRVLINSDLPQIYGTQVGRDSYIDTISNELVNRNFLYPISDTISIDSLRMWNGLGPLEDYLNSFGLSRWE